ncbi:hypothetical protein [Pseudoalteromonas sp. SR41-6]|uniref:hypothetical protein n=1 Tax=Pseudoalteromonas sp. SR41-6 TaxID=2760948 RepID=UPI0015FEF3C4|nr:hypothetical protein [Pseudoalteromonas sp. SR41-6]MBB1333976.1 hypothetical protein [Pseudoalteromonas sp. SR41-6]
MTPLNFFYLTSKSVFVCYESNLVINTEDEMLDFINSSTSFGIGVTEDLAQEDYQFNLAESKSITYQS